MAENRHSIDSRRSQREGTDTGEKAGLWQLEVKQLEVKVRSPKCTETPYGHCSVRNWIQRENCDKWLHCLCGC